MIKSKKIAFSALLLFVAFTGKSQVKNSCDSVYTFAENTPEYPGGMKGFYDYLKNFRYEDIGADDPVAAKFTIHILVDTAGHVQDVQVTPETDPGIALQTYLRKMQSWSPASNKEGKVCYRMKIPAYVHLK